MFVVKSGMNSGMFAVFFVIEHFFAINLSAIGGFTILKGQFTIV